MCRTSEWIVARYFVAFRASSTGDNHQFQNVYYTVDLWLWSLDFGSPIPVCAEPPNGIVARYFVAFRTSSSSTLQRFQRQRWASRIHGDWRQHQCQSFFCTADCVEYSYVLYVCTYLPTYLPASRPYASTHIPIVVCAATQPLFFARLPSSHSLTGSRTRRSWRIFLYAEYGIHKTYLMLS